MGINSYIRIEDYLQEVEGKVLIFTLHNFRGEEIERQVLSRDEWQVTPKGDVKVKFKVDEELSSRMVPSTYTLYLYVAKETEEGKYSLFKCLTERGIAIQVRGGYSNGN